MGSFIEVVDLCQQSGQTLATDGEEKQQKQQRQRRSDTMEMNKITRNLLQENKHAVHLKNTSFMVWNEV